MSGVDIRTIILGVVSSAVFAGIVWVLHKLRIFQPFVYRKAKKRIKSAGIVTFYSKRSTFTEDAGTIGCYVSKATREVNYIGFWLSNGLQHQDLMETIVKQINNGITFKFCIISPQSPLIEYYADFLGETKEEILSQINSSLKILINLKANLQEDRKKQLKILAHDKLITTTFWIVDSNDQNSMIQLDHKLYHLPRYNTYGFQIKKTTSNNEFYENLKKSYMSIIENAKELGKES